MGMELESGLKLFFKKFRNFGSKFSLIFFLGFVRCFCTSSGAERTICKLPVCLSNNDTKIAQFGSGMRKILEIVR
jgi:hypothetical protein